MFLVFAPNKLCGPLCTENFSPEALRGIFAAEGSAMTVPPTPKPACVTKASSAPAPPPAPPAPWGWDLRLLPPNHVSPLPQGHGSLLPLSPPRWPSSPPKAKGKADNTEATAKLRCIWGGMSLQPASFGGTCVPSRVALGGPVTSPPSQSCPATTGPFLLCFFLLLLLFFFFLFLFFFLTWPPK